MTETLILPPTRGTFNTRRGAGLFEPSFVHAAWNRNPEGRARLVLSIDVWHPDLTTHEVAALQFIERALSEGEPAG